jgi:hypothetical protein
MKKGLQMSTESVNFSDYENIVIFNIVESEKPKLMANTFKDEEDVLNYFNIDAEVEVDIHYQPENNAIVFLIKPQALVVSTIIGLLSWKAVIGFIVSTVLSYLVGKLFAPKSPNFREANEVESVYNLSRQNNLSKPNAPIPILYGDMNFYPSLVCQPMYYYDNNKQYMMAVYMLSHGSDVALLEVFLGDTPSSKISKDILQYHTITKYTGDYYDDAGVFTPALKNISVASNIQINPAGEDVYYVRYSGASMYLYRNDIGVMPNISLNVGDTIRVEEAPNEGTYYVGELLENTDYIELKTYFDEALTQPTDFGLFPNDAGIDYEEVRFKASNRYIAWADEEFTFSGIGGGVKYITRTANNDGIHFLRDMDSYSLSFNPINQENYTDCTVRDYALERRIYADKGYGGFYIKASNLDLTIDKIQVDFTFPQGIYHQDTDGGNSSHSVTVKVTLAYIDTGSSIDYTFTYSGDSGTPIRFSEFIDAAADGGDIYVYISRVTSDLGNHYVDMTMLEQINALYHKYSLPQTPEGYTYLFVKMRASEEFSTNAQNQIKVHAWRPIERLDEVIRDIYTKGYGGNLEASDLLLPSTPDVLVRGIIDKKYTLLDAMNMIAESQGYLLYPVQSQVKMRKDEAQSIKFHFDDTNIILGSLQLTYGFMDDDYDSIEVSWIDENFIPQSYTYPQYKINPQKVELFGVREETAKYQAEVIYNKRNKRNIEVEFKTDIQGYIPEYLDRISVSVLRAVSDTDALLSGEILARGRFNGDDFLDSPSGEWIKVLDESAYWKQNLMPGASYDCNDSIKCDEIIECFPTDVIWYISFRLPAGEPTTYYMTSTYKVLGDEGERQVYVKIDSLPSLIQPGIFYHFYMNGTITQDFIVHSTKVTGDINTENSIITIKAVSYDESVYPDNAVNETNGFDRDMFREKRSEKL